MLVLTVNAGGSSVKLAVYAIDSILSSESNSDIKPLFSRDTAADVDIEATLKDIMHSKSIGDKPIKYVLHRLVHSGPHFKGPVLIDDDVEKQLHELSSLDELHMPPALKWIEHARAMHDQSIQIATFDTSFFVNLPAVAQTYALPCALTKEYSIRRYGFHGMAHQSMKQQIGSFQPTLAKGRVITLQLGSGCSMTAIQGGKPVDTSMGFTALEGLVMSTRGGDIDAGLLLYLMRMTKKSPEDMERMLYFDSGLLGVSGESKDMRQLEASTNEQSKLAIDSFVTRCVKYIGSYTMLMGGVDAIVFGGGIGEKSSTIRQRIVERLSLLHLQIDGAANKSKIQATTVVGSNSDQSIQVFVVLVDEGGIMVQTTRDQGLFKNDSELN